MIVGQSVIVRWDEARTKDSALAGEISLLGGQRELAFMSLIKFSPFKSGVDLCFFTGTLSQVVVPLERGYVERDLSTLGFLRIWLTLEKGHMTSTIPCK